MIAAMREIGRCADRKIGKDRMMKVEKTEVWIECKQPLKFSDTTGVRGFFGKFV